MHSFISNKEIYANVTTKSMEKALFIALAILDGKDMTLFTSATIFKKSLLKYALLYHMSFP